MRNQIIHELYKLNIPPKLNIFWWKILHNCLPVAVNLNKRGGRVSPDCQLCGEGNEIISHLFYECKVSREIWNLACPELLQSLEPNLDLLFYE